MTKSEPFARLFRSVILDKRLKDTDVRVLALIKTFTDNWRVNQEHIAKELAISISTVNRSINRLDAAGYLTYTRKLKKTGSERCNLRMMHKPSHWNPVMEAKTALSLNVAPASKSTDSLIKIAGQGIAKTTGIPFKTESQPPSNLPPYKEKTNNSYVELTTNTYNEEKRFSGVDEAVVSLWQKYNTPPQGFIPVDPSTLAPVECGLILRMAEDMQATKLGLLQKPGEVTELGLDSQYFKDVVLQELQARSQGIFLKPRLFVQLHESGCAVYAPDDGNRSDANSRQ